MFLLQSNSFQGECERRLQLSASCFGRLEGSAGVFAIISPSGSAGPLQRVNHGAECSATSCRGMINSVSGEERVPFTQLPKKKIPPLPPSSTQHLSLGDKPASKRSVQPPSHPGRAAAGERLGTVGFHFENSRNFKKDPKTHLKEKRNKLRGLKMQKGRKRGKVSSGKSLPWRKMSHAFKNPSIRPVISNRDKCIKKSIII